MKATGMIRRVDDLGRIVLPKDIRRQLNIRECDPLEIFIEKDAVVLKKYSPIRNMEDFAKDYAESLARMSGRIAMVSDMEKFIAVEGGMKELLGRPISSNLRELIDSRTHFTGAKTKSGFIPIGYEQYDIYHETVTRIISSDGDVIGAVLLADTDKEKPMTEADEKLIQAAADFLSKQAEKFES